MVNGLKRTPLHGEHLRLGGKMVPFAGYEMPIQYPEGIQAEHRAVRSAAGVFDVSHMGQLLVRGPGALELIQALVVTDAARLAPGQAQYSLICREDGGVIDDLLIYRLEDEGYLLVVNGACREKDLAWIRPHVDDFEAEVIDRTAESALLAVQGPAAAAILAPFVPFDLSTLAFYRSAPARILDVPALVSRTGYTGEDGFELYLPADAGPILWRALLEAGAPRGLVAVGLGARDSLRLEMGYSLYGSDLDEDHTAVEAGLGRRIHFGKGHFPGREALLKERESGPARSLVGLRLTESGFPRRGYPILAAGREVGSVTSGTVSPTLGVGIALGYVEAGLSEPGTTLAVGIRGREVGARVERPPFHTEGSLKR